MGQGFSALLSCKPGWLQNFFQVYDPYIYTFHKLSFHFVHFKRPQNNKADTGKLCSNWDQRIKLKQKQTPLLRNEWTSPVKSSWWAGVVNPQHYLQDTTEEHTQIIIQLLGATVC